MPIALVQKTTATIKTSTFTISLSGVTAGNCLTLIMSYGRSSTTSAPLAPTDGGSSMSVGIAPTPQTTITTVTTGAAIWYELNVTGGTHTITVSEPDIFCNVTLAEWSGIAAVSAADQTGVEGTNTSIQTSTVTASGATAKANELAIVALAISGANNGENITDPPAGYTSLLVFGNGSAWNTCEHAYQVLSSVTTPSATWSWTDAGTDNHQSVLLTLIGSSSGAYSAPRSSGPGVSPDKRTMFRGRQLSAFIAPNSLGGGAASWQAGGFGQLTGTMAAPVIGLQREFGPGPSPDYRKAFQRPALSTTVPTIAPITGVASWQGGGYGNIAATAAIQGIASWQGYGSAATLSGAGVLTGLAPWQGAGLAQLSSGTVTNITGMASWQGGGYGVLTGAAAMTGVAGGQAGAYGALAGAGVLTGTASWQGSGFGAAGGLGNLQGVASWQAASAGSLVGTAALLGRANVEGQAFGTLVGDGALLGRASWTGGAYGTVVGVGALAGVTSGQGGAFGAMQGSLLMAGLASWQGFTQGLLLPTGAGQMQGLAAAFSYAYGSLTGNGHAFGWAVVTAVSQNGLPVARACYIEESSSRVTASYFDANGLPFVPNAVRYRIDDVASGANIAPWTSIAPEVANTITVTSAQNAMISLSRTSESHQVLFEITDAFGNVSYEDVSFDVIRVAGLG